MINSVNEDQWALEDSSDETGPLARQINLNNFFAPESLKKEKKKVKPAELETSKKLVQLDPMDVPVNTDQSKVILDVQEKTDNIKKMIDDIANKNE